MARFARVRTATDEAQMRKIGARIKRAREARGMTQMELAPLLGFGRPTSISMIESGHAPISPMDLLRLSSIFGRPVGWFLGQDAWPRDLESWLLLANGNRRRAISHYELDQQLDRELEPSIT